MASFFFYKNIFRANLGHTDAAVIDELNEIVQNNDILNASLLLAQEYCQDIDIEQANIAIDKIVNEIEVRIKNTDNPKEIMGIINDYLFVEYQIQPDGAIVIDHLLLDRVLENRKGHCIGLSLLYLVLGERLHLPVYAKMVPSHMYLCYDDGLTKFNIETTMKGFACTDNYYSYHFPYPERHRTIKKISKREVLGLFLGNIGYYLRESPNAIDIQKKALQLYPDSAEINANMGLILWKLNELKQAKKYLTKAIKLNPNSWQANLEISHLYYKSGDYKQASESYIQVINLLHRSVKILSSYHHGLPEKEKLIELAGKMLQSREVSGETLVAFGVGLFQQEEYELSNKLFAYALKMCPEELDTHAYYAMTNIHLGNYELARKHAQIVDETREQATLYNNTPMFFINKIAYCHMRLGQSHAFLKKYELALNETNKAIEIGGPNSEFFCVLAATYLLKGDKAEAIKYYKKALGFALSNKWIQKQISNLQSDYTK